MRWAIGIVAAAMASTAWAASPLGLRPPVAGARTQVMTLGSVHLSEQATFTPAMLEPLLTNLARYRPTVITIEGVSGEQCDFMRRAPRYKDAVETYCVDPAPAQALAKMTLQEAEVASQATLDRWAAPGAVAPTASDRRGLALLFLAAGDRGSAWVQWLRVPVSERIAADGLDQALVDGLNRKGRPMNESYSIAATLAARLGLERLYAADDHSSDGALVHAGKAYEEALTKHWTAGRNDPSFGAYMARSKAVTDGKTMLGLLRYLNDPAVARQNVVGDFGAALKYPAIAPYGRQYVAWWEIRNLRMAANWRAAFAEQPGARVLNIVGASHKPWYDMFAGTMSDVDLVPVEPFLR